MSRYTRALLPLVAWLVLSAHVGTNQVVQEGMAGPYQVRVMINPPGVVPAQVPIVVRVLHGKPSRVTVRAAQWNLGLKGAPPAEEASPIAGETGLFAHDLWIMTASTYAVHVALEGAEGNGEFVVPVQTASTRTLGMQRTIGAILLALGALLVSGLVSIVSAAAREASVNEGEVAPTSRRKNARIAGAITAAVVAVALLGGFVWWNAEEGAYRQRLYKPLASSGSVSANGASMQLVVAITDSLWQSNTLPPLVPDHGKLMHLFLVRLESADVIAHLHPQRTAADSFVSMLPPLPLGKYAMYGDLLFEGGAQRTLVDTVAITGNASGASSPTYQPSEPDDAWRAVMPVPIGASAALAGGGTMTLKADANITAGRDLRLTASVSDADGKASMLEPYMGMAGHAMIFRRDASMFVHLHPMGTASTAAQFQLQQRERSDSAHGAIDGDSSTMHGMAMDASPAFPFAFPAAGDYRMFVQVKRRGSIETAAFDITVR